ncbi:MAG: hypothetical protein HOV83_20750 [Catenulispora sp.]|nr:hypothetical protein [Catenulispora sp.]
MSRTARRVRLTAAVTAALAGVGSVFALETPAHAAPTVIVGGTSYQKIDGFGISESFNMANAIRGLGATAQKQALDLLFSTSNGAGFSIIRNDIPAG